jgi:CIC family chloride channel protein
LRSDQTLTQASEFFSQSHRHGVPVVNALDELIGIFTLQDLDRIDPTRWSTLTVGETCTRDLVVTYPDETIGAALRKMGTRDIGRIPVVSRENPRQLLGILRRSDLVRSYSVALSRRAVIRH